MDPIGMGLVALFFIISLPRGTCALPAWQAWNWWMRGDGRPARWASPQEGAWP